MGRSKHFTSYYSVVDSKRNFSLLNGDGTFGGSGVPGTTFKRTSHAPDMEEKEHFHRCVTASRRMVDEYKKGGIRIFRDD
mmetsp:Transcript_16015/g.40470  ORF Transcript_16015/g.40470 Transcript_16015/m.40470 type:complete len:80 (-) Transcript_16015:1501-1740(-)